MEGGVSGGGGGMSAGALSVQPFSHSTFVSCFYWFFSFFKVIH